MEKSHICSVKWETWTKSYLREITTFYQWSYSTHSSLARENSFCSIPFSSDWFLCWNVENVILLKNKTQNINSSVNRWFHFPRFYNCAINSMMSYILFRTPVVSVCLLKLLSYSDSDREVLQVLFTLVEKLQWLCCFITFYF